MLLLDIEMPVMDGVEVARRLHEAHVDVRILILSAYDDREYIRSLLDIGVSGYLIKGEAPGKIIEAVRGVVRGQKGWVSPQVRKKLERMQKLPDKQETLTYRELEILRLLSLNKADQEIASFTKVSEREVSLLIKSLLKRLNLNSREKAVEIAIREEWI